MRRRERKDLDHFERSMLELHYYSRPLAEMRRAVEAKPDLMYDADVGGNDVVFDVGAYHGDWSEEIARRYAPTIYAFEPDPMSFPELAARFAGRPRMTSLQYGLGAATATAQMSLAGVGSSTFGHDAAFGTQTVEIRDVVSVLAELRLDAVDLMKVNIEGGEYDLFDRLIETDRLRHIRQVLVQFHEWHPKAYRRRRTIRRALARTHREVWCYPWIWELWRRERA